jgi:hypothetical protein
LLPQAHQKFNWYDSCLILEAPPLSVFDTTLISVRYEQPDSLQVHTPVYGNMIEILPGDIALVDNATLKVKAAPLPENYRWGVFSLSSNQLSFISDTYTEGYFIFNTNSFGKYIIATDTLPPELQIRSPIMFQNYRNNPPVNFLVRDNLSGVDGENGITLTVDSMFVLPEWDPEEDLIKAVIDDPLPPGAHMLYIEVKDFLHNVARDSVHFYIRNNR